MASTCGASIAGARPAAYRGGTLRRTSTWHSVLSTSNVAQHPGASYLVFGTTHSADRCFETQLFRRRERASFYSPSGESVATAARQRKEMVCRCCLPTVLGLLSDLLETLVYGIIDRTAERH